MAELFNGLLNTEDGLKLAHAAWMEGRNSVFNDETVHCLTVPQNSPYYEKLMNLKNERIGE